MNAKQETYGENEMQEELDNNTIPRLKKLGIGHIADKLKEDLDNYYHDNSDRDAGEEVELEF